MGSHTKIIDLFGTPACGKSTLARYIKENSALRVAEKVDVSRECRKYCYLLFMWSFSVRDIVKCIRYHYAIPKIYRRKGSPLWKFIKNYAYYHYIQRYSSFDVVIFDNSIVQSIVSHQNGVDLLSDSRFRKSVTDLLRFSEPVSFWWCDVDPVVALERMIHRDRPKGRIDLKTTEQEKYRELVSEHALFRKFYDLLSEGHADVRTVNCEKGIAEIYTNIQTAINQLQKGDDEQ